MKSLFFFFLIISVFAVCGDRLCETSEIGNCIDCSTINTNYVCDQFPNSIPSYDPDCNTTVSQTCYDSEFTYSDGRGTSCFPGNCTEGVGCTSSCSIDTHCSSNFCISNTCEKTCDNCNITATYDVQALGTTIYFGQPTFVSFRVNRNGGTSPVAISARGPCTLNYTSSLTLGSYGIVVVRIDNCKFKGVSSIELTAGSAKGTVHFLSYPTLMYSIGDMPKSGVGSASMSSKMNAIPLEVKTWVN